MLNNNYYGTHPKNPNRQSKSLLEKVPPLKVKTNLYLFQTQEPKLKCVNY